MKAFGIFCASWFGFTIVGSVWCVLMHIDLKTKEMLRILVQTDVLKVLLIGYLLAAILVFYLFTPPYREPEPEPKKKNIEPLDVIAEKHEASQNA